MVKLAVVLLRVQTLAPDVGEPMNLSGLEGVTGSTPPVVRSRCSRRRPARIPGSWGLVASGRWASRPDARRRTSCE